MGEDQQLHKSHRTPQSGPSAKKKSTSSMKKRGHSDDKQPNPKTFACKSNVKAKRMRLQPVEEEQRRLHLPTIDRATGEPAPFVVVVHGPPMVGKSSVIKSLVKHYTKHNLPEVSHPITIGSGKQRRLQLVECPNIINGMVDAAKFADLALFLIDGSYGFEMETFEFLNILQVHGFPKVMGVLRHLDKFKDVKKLRKTKQRLKHRIWTEIYDGAKLFFLSRLIHGKYAKREIHNLARFISVMKFPPLSWRACHPYVLVDRFEDVTPPEQVQMNNKCDRNVILYGYLRGCNMKRGTKPIERKLRKFNPLVIPKSLQKDLPYSSKPKDTPRRRSLLENKRAVVMKPHERNVHSLVQNLQLIRREKMKPHERNVHSLVQNLQLIRLENKRAVVMKPHERNAHSLVQNLQLIRLEKMRKRKLKEKQKRKVVDAEKAKNEEISRKR